VVWFSLQLLSETLLILKTTEQDIIINVHKSSYNTTCYSCQILMKLELLGVVSNNAPISNFMMIRSVGTELFHAEGQTEMTKPIVSFRNFTKATKRTWIINTITS
jgi:hypothetical protein